MKRTASAIAAAFMMLMLLGMARGAAAESWVMVAKSKTTLEQQYVDADSIQVLDQEHGSPSRIRLKTYWGMLDQPDSVTMAVTEYRCQQKQYRDVAINGAATDEDWQPIGGDSLNRAAMEYGCRQASSHSTPVLLN